MAYVMADLHREGAKLGEKYSSMRVFQPLPTLFFIFTKVEPLPRLTCFMTAAIGTIHYLNLIVTL